MSDNTKDKRTHPELGLLDMGHLSPLDRYKQADDALERAQLHANIAVTLLNRDKGNINLANAHSAIASAYAKIAHTAFGVAFIEKERTWPELNPDDNEERES